MIVVFGGATVTGVNDIDWADVTRRIVSGGLIAGTWGEVVFRGVFFRLIEEVTGTWISLGASSLLFGLVHANNPDMTLVDGLVIALQGGIVLGVIYAFTRSLWVVIGFHAAWNMTQGPIFGIGISGHPGHPGILQTTLQGSEIISGGSGGAEFSIIAIVVTLLLAAAVAVLLVRGRAVVAPMWVRRARQRAAMADASRDKAKSTVASAEAD